MESERELREMDARVAREVMGWEFKAATSLQNPWHVCVRCGRHCEVCRGSECEFSDDIAAAWSVVEAMRAKGWFVEITTGVGTVSVEFWLPPSGRAAYEAPTMPLAVCTAALAAIAAGGK